MDFKVPSLIPQDLQIIQDLIGELPPPPVIKSAIPEPNLHKSSEESVESSDNESDTDSEREVEADILGDLDSEAESTPPVAAQAGPGSTSDSESSDESDSDSEDEVPFVQRNSKAEDVLMDDDEEGGAAVVSPEQMRTKNEVADVAIVVPEVEQVDEHERLEKVGEVFSIVDKVAIVKGLPQQVQGRVSDRALDSDTLLVFEDRKVLGYVWETFGPTAQPFYRVQFNDAYPLDTDKVRISREVFHVPSRSKFVSVSFLKQYKGSDASNAHDEEPAEDELEFSDDEAEREHKRALKDKRFGSEAPSRQTTPMPGRSRDDDDPYGAGGPYSDAPYDQDLHAGTSRPPPKAYDDPYSLSYGLPEPSSSTAPPPEPTAEPMEPLNYFQPDRSRGRGRGRGGARDGPTRDRGRGRGRGGVRERGRGRGRGRGGGGAGGGDRDSWGSHMAHNADGHNLQTGHAQPYGGDAAYSAPQHAAAQSIQSGWGYQQYPTWGQGDFGYEYQQAFVQPHINPRFASQFGLNMGYAQPMPYAGYEQYGAGYPMGGWMPDGAQWTDGEHSQQSPNAPGDGNGAVKREPS